MSKNNIEVEIRSFISKKQYNELLKFFKKESKLIKKDKQKTIYFDSKQDLRIQKNNSTTKIWLKKGKVHDEFREETEILTKKEDFEKWQEIFKTLGYKEEIVWIRERAQFLWKRLTVCLDYTVGYGYIIELEKMSNEKKKKEDLKNLNLNLKKLGVKKTPRKDFEDAFKTYKRDWKKLIKKELE